jgi:hypothetical protein
MYFPEWVVLRIQLGVISKVLIKIWLPKYSEKPAYCLLREFFITCQRLYLISRREAGRMPRPLQGHSDRDP